MTDQRTLRVAMIGHAFMGNAHSQAWRTAPYFFSLPLRPELALLVGRDAGRAAEAATRLGWTESSTDWREAIARDDIDLVDICTPGDTHAEIAIAALEAGKHVLCEKPLANTVAEAAEMTAAAEKARANGVLTMVGFTYRRVPAIGLARQLVAEGKIGDIRHVRAQYLQDWISDPEAPLSWRLDKEKAGSGALGDIGAHIVDLTQFITGDRIVELTGRLETFVKERPYPAGDTSGSLGGGGTSVERGPVTVDDAASFLATFSSGAMGVFEATRFANGRKNAIRIEINGSLGSIAFDFEDMNVLEFFDATQPAAVGGFRRIIVTEAEHPYVAAWWPPGHGLGYEHGFTHQVVDLVTAIAEGTDPSPTFADGLQVQRVLDAVETSSETRTWQEIPQ
ncbi:gfo/Idh/MocA family oxidoreductase [Nocardioides sp. MAH-18]|uniref:Gfo/Idh/MocA family oxidoreductase n=1 Tax=Nocardioides agri TaxID=2682843 RepID=A0A6L6XTJ5_9ACTN|nr:MULTISPECIES: Gfo/Idh/MocA family oxidoreductase [unclassified Nocardioides]MBA2955875.1 Gfo/Idh/MocA family oxidoreductase [Nocardioides sp. CGMCC 1.13656]MVQ50724.1 gfo/Idh/MocA family oxidoreductase [Nocardioides sp. MAH-18]